MKRTIAVVFVVFAACGGEHYSDAFRTAFMDNCERTSGGNISYCQCALDHLEDSGKAEDEITSSDMASAVTACR